MAGAEATIQGNPAPNVKPREQQDVQDMAEDIGLLQNTIIRAPFSKLPSPTSWEFYSYFWSMVKARFTALYTRSHFKRCVHKKGIMSYLPVDFLKQKELKNRAKRMYTRYYGLLAAGDAKSLQQLCLPPLAASLRSQIASRGPVKMSWQLRKFKSAKVVSHRCAPLGSDHPDTSYRQCVVRLESEQQLSTSSTGSSVSVHKRAPKWAPAHAQKAEVVSPATQNVQIKDNGKVQTVVEYLVMQTRVVDGKEEDWKIWGFTAESTPSRIEEDEQYWKRMLDIQTSNAA